MRAILSAAALTVLISPGIADARDFDLALFSGGFRTHGLLSVQDEAMWVIGLDARMQVRGRLGYFVHFATGPTAHRWSGDGTLVGVFAVGPFARLSEGPVRISWRIGYGAAGDERYAQDLLLHGFTAARFLGERTFLRADIHHVLLGFNRFGSVGITIGVGWRL